MTPSPRPKRMRLPTVGTLIAAVAAASLALQAMPVRADVEPPKCPEGKIWSDSDGKCIPKRTGVLTDEELYARGWRLAKAGHYESAIRVLNTVADRTDPKVLNALGYSHRKMGRLAEGVAFYQRALAIDPDYVLAREYLGEGYVAAGRFDLAKDQLAEIEMRCGTGCKEYRRLAAVISGAETQGW